MAKSLCSCSTASVRPPIFLQAYLRCCYCCYSCMALAMPLGCNRRRNQHYYSRIQRCCSRNQHCYSRIQRCCS